MKRILCLGLILTVLCTMLTFTPVSAATIIDSGTCGAQGDNVKWTLDSEGTLTISGTGEMEDYEALINPAPWYYKYKNIINKVIIDTGITSIGSGTFSLCEKVTDVNIPNSVIRISRQAFENCIGLLEITIPNGVTEICDSAFRGCINLKKVDFPNTLISIGQSSFNDCSNLVTINIPDSVINVGGFAFSGCTKLRSVNMGNNVKSIEDGAFSECPQLTSLTIPKNTTSIGKNICENCGSVNYDVSPQNVCFSSQNGVLFNKEKTELISYAKDKIQPVYDIPYGVEKIAIGAFAYCENLTKITIPDSVISIGIDVFYNTGLYETQMYTGKGLYDGDAYYIDNYLIDVKGDISTFTVKEGTIAIAGGAFAGGAYFKSEITQLYIPRSIKNIGESNFNYSCSSITDVYYAGSKTEWEQIVIENDNDALNNANIHFMGVDPAPTAEPNAPSIEITGVSSNRVSAKIGNCKSKDAKVILAVYSKSGALIEMQETDIFDEVYFLSGNLNNTNIKVMLWSGTDSVKPLAETAEMSL